MPARDYVIGYILPRDVWDSVISKAFVLVILPLSPRTGCNTPAQVLFHRTAGKAASQWAACHINCSNLCLETRKGECGKTQARARRGHPISPHLDLTPQTDGEKRLANSQDPLLYLQALQTLQTQRGQGQCGRRHRYNPASTPRPTPAFRCPGFCMEMPAVLGTVTGPWLANQPFTVPDYTDWIRVEGK